MTRPNHILAITAITSLMWMACEEERPAAMAPPRPRTVSAASGGGLGGQPTAAVPQPLIYTYNPNGKRDPFRSPLDVKSGAAAQSDRQCNDPLCQWELDQLTLVAVVTGDANPIAMVEDPQGTGYVVRRNSFIGRQNGRVSQILRDSVIVTEYFTGPDGKRNPNNVTMPLKEDRTVRSHTDLLTGQKYQ